MSYINNLEVDRLACNFLLLRSRPISLYILEKPSGQTKSLDLSGVAREKKQLIGNKEKPLVILVVES